MKVFPPRPRWPAGSPASRLDPPVSFSQTAWISSGPPRKRLPPAPAATDTTRTKEEPVPRAPATEQPVAAATENPRAIRLRFPPHDEGTAEARAGGGRALPAGYRRRRIPPRRFGVSANRGSRLGRAREEAALRGPRPHGVVGSRPAPEGAVTPTHPAIEERQENPKPREKWQEETLTNGDGGQEGVPGVWGPAAAARELREREVRTRLREHPGICGGETAGRLQNWAFVRLPGLQQLSRRMNMLTRARLRCAQSEIVKKEGYTATIPGRCCCSAGKQMLLGYRQWL